MMYQVMIQTPCGWTLFRLPTPSAQEARDLAQQAAAACPGMHARILTAATTEELDHLCEQWRYNHPGGIVDATVDAADTPGYTTPGTIEWWHARMNAVELGPGGDHNAPYTYQAPAHMELKIAWLCLQARVTRGEVGGPHDGDFDMWNTRDRGTHDVAVRQLGSAA